MARIVSISGSPRAGGNSEALARKVCETAERLGATTQTFRLYDLNYRGCVACMACKEKAEECVVRDGLTEVLRAAREADILVLSSPIYIGQISGELKCCIDRMFSFMKPGFTTSGDPSRLAPGKKCLFVLTQAHPAEEFFAEVHPGYARFFGPDWLGCELHLLRGLGLGELGDAPASAELMQQAEEMGRRLMA